ILSNRERLAPDVLARASALTERHQQGIRDAIRAGVTVAAGTDAGTPFNYAERFGTELEALVEIGMTPERALAAATSVAADAVGLLRLLGRANARPRRTASLRGRARRGARRPQRSARSTPSRRTHTRPRWRPDIRAGPCGRGLARDRAARRHRPGRRRGRPFA